MSDYDTRPPRPWLTCRGYLDLLPPILDGDPHPFYGLDVGDLLADIGLTLHNETSRLTERAESAEGHARDARRAELAVWRLVHQAGKRKTMRTDDVRSALEGD